MKNTLLDKYNAIILMGLSQREWGVEYLPKFRSIARELNITPQNLHYLWKNRKEIISKARNSIPEEILSSYKSRAAHKVFPSVCSTTKDLNILKSKKSFKSFSNEFDRLLLFWCNFNQISKM
ncbi:hypothetical protein ACFLZA_02960 [Candidatus Neomarinimicrobiota bacterium]